MFRLIGGLAKLIGFGVLALAAVWAYRSYVSPVPTPAEVIFSPPPPAPVGPTPVPTVNVDAKLASMEAQVRQEASAGRRTPVSLSLNDEEMTSRANQAVARGELQLPVTDIQVRTTPGQIVMTARTKTSVVSLPFTLTTVPHVLDNKAQLEVTRIDFGSVPVPQGISTQLTSVIGSDSVLGDLPLKVTAFRAEQGRVVIEGTT